MHNDFDDSGYDEREAAEQATEQQPDPCKQCGSTSPFHCNTFVGGTEPRGLARLDAAGLAELRAIILTVIDDGRWPEQAKGKVPWSLYEGAFGNVVVPECEADAERLLFCDRIQQAIIDATTPAVRYRPAFWRKPDDPLTCRQCTQHLNDHSADGQLCPRRAAPATAGRVK